MRSSPHNYGGASPPRRPWSRPAVQTPSGGASTTSTRAGLREKCGYDNGQESFSVTECNCDQTERALVFRVNKRDTSLDATCVSVSNPRHAVGMLHQNFQNFQSRAFPSVSRHGGGTESRGPSHNTSQPARVEAVISRGRREDTHRVGVPDRLIGASESCTEPVAFAGHHCACAAPPGMMTATCLAAACCSRSPPALTPRCTRSSPA